MSNVSLAGFRVRFNSITQNTHKFGHSLETFHAEKLTKTQPNTPERVQVSALAVAADILPAARERYYWHIRRVESSIRSTDMHGLTTIACIGLTAFKRLPRTRKANGNGRRSARRGGQMLFLRN